MRLRDYFAMEFATVETDWIDLEILPGWERAPDHPTRARRTAEAALDVQAAVRPVADFDGERSAAQVRLPVSLRPATDYEHVTAYPDEGHLWRQTVEFFTDGRVVIGEPEDLGCFS